MARPLWGAARNTGSHRAGVSQQPQPQTKSNLATALCRWRTSRGAAYGIAVLCILKSTYYRGYQLYCGLARRRWSIPSLSSPKYKYARRHAESRTREFSGSRIEAGIAASLLHGGGSSSAFYRKHGPHCCIYVPTRTLFLRCAGCSVQQYTPTHCAVVPVRVQCASLSLPLSLGMMVVVGVVGRNDVGGSGRVQ